MSYLASVGKLLDISLEELIVSQSVMNNAMLRSGKGARQLARALVQVAKAPQKLKALGVVFDETKPLDFVNLMEQLIDLYGDQQNAGADLLLQILEIKKNLTREVKKQVEETEEQNKVVLKLIPGMKERLDKEVLLGRAKASQTFTTRELLNLEKKLIANSQFSIGQYDQIVKLRQLENKILIDTVKQQVQARNTLVYSQIKILELEDI